MWPQCISAQPTQPRDNAAAIYIQAVNAVEKNNDAGIYPPSSSNLVYLNYPPYPAEWHRLEAIDFSANSHARELAHQARLIDHVNWAALNLQGGGLSYLNPCRGLCNVMVDAAFMEHEQKDDAAAIETIRDMWGLAAAVEDIQATGSCLLTGIAIQATSLHQLEAVTSGIVLTKTSDDKKSVDAAVARALINDLITHPDAKTEATDFRRKYGADMANAPAYLPGSIIEIINSIDAERDLAAMSLACHLYRLDTGEWPRSEAGLGKYISPLPVDSFGDGTQTLGYALIKGGLPDGSDRPLVYSRYRTEDGLFFRVDRPEYGSYNGEGLDVGNQQQKHGGQFRDVASWSPPEGSHPVASTRPLN